MEESNVLQSKSNRRLKWTDEMNPTLLECKRKAQNMVKLMHLKLWMEIVRKVIWQ